MASTNEQQTWRVAIALMPSFAHCLTFTEWDRYPEVERSMSDAWTLVDVLYPLNTHFCGDDAIVAKRLLWACAPRFVAHVQNLPEPRLAFTNFVRTFTRYAKQQTPADAANILAMRTGPHGELWSLLVGDIDVWPGGNYDIGLVDSPETFIAVKLANLIELFLRDKLHVRIQWDSESLDCKVLGLGPRDGNRLTFSAVFEWPHPETEDMEYVTEDFTASVNDYAPQVFRWNSPIYYHHDITFVEEDPHKPWHCFALPGWVKKNIGPIYDPMALGIAPVLHTAPSLRETVLRHVFHPQMWPDYTRSEQRRVLAGLGLLLLDSRKVKRKLQDLDQEEGSLITRESDRELAETPELAKMPNNERVKQERKKRPRLGNYAFSVR